MAENSVGYARLTTKGVPSMHKLSLLPALVLALILMPACGGGGGGDDDDDDIVGGVDASPAGTPDAAPVGSPDAASTAITAGLGKTCNAATDCAPPTQGCLQQKGQPGICSGICKDGYVVTSDASGQLAMPPASDSSHQTCVNLFSGTVGIPVCGAITSISPPVPDGTVPAPNTEYTLQLACGGMADNGVWPSNLTPYGQGLCSPYGPFV